MKVRNEIKEEGVRGAIQDHGGNMKPTIKRFNDGSRARIYPDGTYSLILPDSTNPKGKETTEAAATLKVDQLHVEWVYSRYQLGRHSSHGYLIPIRDHQTSTW
jgi:hypothetical protein